MAKKRKKKRKRKKRGPGASASAPPFPRLGWSRSPVQKPHSTKKGERGYDRKRSKTETRQEVDESSGS